MDTQVSDGSLIATEIYFAAHDGAPCERRARGAGGLLRGRQVESRPSSWRSALAHVLVFSDGLDVNGS